MGEAATPSRPRVVLIAVGLLWLHLFGVISNYIMLGLHQTMPVLLGLMVIGCLLMLVIRNIGRGARWARLAYVPVFAVGIAYSGLMLSSGMSASTRIEATSVSPDAPYCFDCGDHMPGWLGLSMWKWNMISDFIAASLGLLLIVAALLLFCPSANRWFRPATHGVGQEA